MVPNNVGGYYHFLKRSTFLQVLSFFYMLQTHRNFCQEAGLPMKKAFQIIKTTFVWLIVALSVFMMIFTVISVTTFNRNDRDLFGYKAYIVNTDSMSATDFNAGDLIFVKEVDPTTIQVGDIITFISQNDESFGQTVTHKVRKLTRDANGNPGFVTYGTTTNTDDATVVTFPYILGKYQSHLPYVGTFFQFLKTPQGYIVCIFVPFMLLILYQGINCIKLFRRYKGEQLEEMNAEKARIEEERAQNAKMMEELLALKAQLQMQSNTPQQPEPGEGGTEDAES
jgi:signal peptidase